MAIENDEWKRISSLLSNPREANQKGDMLLPEDAAWVDSCFVKDDSELSDESWNSLKDAIWDVISQSTSPIEEPSNATSGLGEENDEDEPSNMMNDDDEPFKNLRMPTNEDEEINPVPPAAYIRNDILLNPYDTKENRDSDAEVGLGSLDDAESPENIFRVWDLEIPFEEDELLIQLKKAITESSLWAAPPTVDDSVSNDQDLDELIAGIADLSLHPDRCDN